MSLQFFFVENIMMDDLDDGITSFVAAECVSANVLQESFLKKRKGGGSVPGKARNVDRGIHVGARKLFNDYDVAFRRRYRMSKTLFLRVHNSVVESGPYFIQKADAAGFLGCTALQKSTAAMRQLCYNVTPDSLDENLRISKTVADESLIKFALLTGGKSLGGAN